MGVSKTLLYNMLLWLNLQFYKRVRRPIVVHGRKISTSKNLHAKLPTVFHVSQTDLYLPSGWICQVIYFLWKLKNKGMFMKAQLTRTSHKCYASSHLTSVKTYSWITNHEKIDVFQRTGFRGFKGTANSERRSGSNSPRPNLYSPSQSAPKISSSKTANLRKQKDYKVKRIIYSTCSS